MKIHEFQGKEIFRKAGVAVLDGKVAYDAPRRRPRRLRRWAGRWQWSKRRFMPVGEVRALSKSIPSSMACS